MKNVLKFIGIAFIALNISSCGDDDSPTLPTPPEVLPNIVEIASEAPGFSILVEALTRESFGDTYTGLLSGDGPFTVLAPTNEAFADLLAELGLSSLDDIDDNTLQAVLAYHVIPGVAVTSDDLPESAKTLGGGDISIDPSNATFTDPNGRMSGVVLADILASNGVIHGIDKVILPLQGGSMPSGGTISGGPFEFNVGDGEEDKIAEGAITVEGAVGESFQWVVTDADGVTVLGLPGSFTGPDFEGAGVGECKIWYLAYNGELTGAAVNGLVADIAGDFSLSNAISVNRVAAPNIVEIATGNPDFSLLVEAVTRPSFGTTYTDLLSGAGPLTVFAPTNEAFVALLAELELTSLDEVDDNTLQAVLAMHVISGAKVKSDMLPAMATTLGGDITIDPATAIITDANGRMSTVIMPDVFASNGVVHVIDKVILPQM